VENVFAENIFRLCSSKKKMIQQDSTGGFLFGPYEKYKLFPEYFKRYSLYLQYKNSLEKHFSETNLVEHLKK